MGAPECMSESESEREICCLTTSAHVQHCTLQIAQQTLAHGHGRTSAQAGVTHLIAHATAEQRRVDVTQ